MSLLIEVLTTLVNGLSNGLILVLVAVGLSLIFGLMGVLNFAHGALFMLGGYVGLAVMLEVGNGITGFVAALVAAPIVVAVVGMGLEKTVFQPLYDTEPLNQLLLTFGLAVVIEEVVKLIWGEAPPQLPPRPDVFDGNLIVAGINMPYYRLFTAALGITVVVLVTVFLRYTRYGLVVRAGMYDDDKTRVLGLNVDRAFTVVFGVGASLAALGGVVYIFRSGLNPAVGSDIILSAFIVVIIGGLGSFRGSILAGLLVGVVEQFVLVYEPRLAGAITFLLMVAVLLARPQGLLGEAEVEV